MELGRISILNHRLIWYRYEHRDRVNNSGNHPGAPPCMVRETKRGDALSQGHQITRQVTFEIPRTTDDSNWPRTPAALEFEYVLYLVGIVVRHKARDKERWQGWGTHSSCASFCSAGACRRLKTLWTDASARVLFPHAAARNPLPGRPSSFQGIFESQHLGRTAGAQEEITCVNLRTDLVKTLFASWHQPFFSKILQFC
jgi:hypothetical protein